MIQEPLNPGDKGIKRVQLDMVNKYAPNVFLITRESDLPNHFHCHGDKEIRDIVGLPVGTTKHTSTERYEIYFRDLLKNPTTDPKQIREKNTFYKILEAVKNPDYDVVYLAHHADLTKPSHGDIIIKLINEYIDMENKIKFKQLLSKRKLL